MNQIAKLHILIVYSIILSLTVAGSQASSDATNEMVIGGVSDTAGAYVKNIDNPTSLQAIEDYAFGAAKDLVDAGVVSLANYAIYKSIIYKGASEIVAARAVGNYAAAKAIQDATIAKASAVMGGLSVGATIVTLALVVVGITFPNHTDDDCAVNPSDCAQSGLGTPLLQSPTSDKSSGAGSSVSGSYGASKTGKSKADMYIRWWESKSHPPMSEFDPDNSGIPLCPRYILMADPSNPATYNNWVLNEYGYNWIHHAEYTKNYIISQEYRNQVNAYLASFESTAAGVGPLVDEGQNGGGSW